MVINGMIRGGKGVWNAALTLDKLDTGSYKECLTNYPLQHPLVRQISLYEFLSLLKREHDFSKVLLSIQEIWAWLNSHRSMSDVSELEDALVFQSGKLGFDIICDTQINMRTLGSLREMTSERWLAEKFGDTKADFETGYFQYTQLDKRFKDNVPLDGFVPVRIPFTVAALWWDRFNTYERTMPFGYGKMLLSMAAAEPAIMNEEVNAAVELLYKNRELLGSKVDRVSVKSALLELGHAGAGSGDFCGLVGHRFVLGRKRNHGVSGGGDSSNIVPIPLSPQIHTPLAERRVLPRFRRVR